MISGLFSISPQRRKKIVNYLSSVTPAYYCENCNTLTYQKGEKYKLCGKCKSVRYCSIECQRAHIITHKEYCSKDLKEYASNLRKLIKEYNERFSFYIAQSLNTSGGKMKEIIIDND